MNENGYFLGMITSNLKFKENISTSTSTSTSNIDINDDIIKIERLIPSVNFSIPIHQLKFIQNYLNDKDMNHLLKFNKFNKILKNIWEFNDIDEDNENIQNEDLKNLKFIKFLKRIESGEFKNIEKNSKL